ncbi:MAG: PLP-dependent transferase [bacterium]|nr:MAG: PLP-dependent transferase [bacterium]
MPCSDTDAVLNSLLRLSVGIENMDDLMEDVTQVTDR